MRKVEENNIQNDDYKYIPFGLIPSEWRPSELGKLGVFTKGKGITKEELSLNGNPCIRYGEIYTTHDFIIKKFHSFIADNIAKDSKEIFDGDILFAGSGETLEEIGKCAAYVGKERAYAGGDIIILSTNKEVDPIFLSFALHADYVNKQKRRFGQGHSVVHIYSSDLAKLQIAIPSYSEQKKISNTLLTWDSAIESTENLIATKEQYKKSMMQQLLTRKKKLLGFDGEWKKTRIGDLVKEVKRPIEWNEGTLYDLISVRRRSGGVFYRESLYGHQILTKGLFTAKSGDFLISKMQIVHGASGMVKKEHDGMRISGSYIALHSKDVNKLDMEFFDWLSKMPEFYHLCYTSSYGVHIEKMTFDFQDFLHRQISIPTNVKEQKHIVLILNTLVKEIDLLKSQLELYRQQKKGLMQVLLTGAVRVKI